MSIYICQMLLASNSLQKQKYQRQRLQQTTPSTSRAELTIPNITEV